MKICAYDVHFFTTRGVHRPVRPLQIYVYNPTLFQTSVVISNAIG